MASKSSNNNSTSVGRGKSWHSPSQDRLDSYIIYNFRLFSLCAIAATYLSGTMGIVLIGKSGVCFFSKYVWANGSEKGNLEDPLHVAISGLEFFFLAPLAYLVLRSLSEYVEDLQYKDRQAKNEREEEIEWELTQLGLADAGKDSFQSASDAAFLATEKRIRSKEFLPIGKEGLLETKALTIALLFAIVATHLIGRLIGAESGNSSVSKFTTSEGVIGLTLLGVLAAIYFGIESMSASLKWRDIRAIRKSRAAKDKPSSGPSIPDVPLVSPHGKSGE